MTDPLLLFLPRQQHPVPPHAHDVGSAWKVLLGDGDPGVGAGPFDGLDEFDVFLPRPAVVAINSRVDVPSEALPALPRLSTGNHLGYASPNARLEKGGINKYRRSSI